MPRTNATTASPMAEIQRFEALSADVARPRSVNVGTSPPTQPPLPVDQSSVSASVRLEAVFVEEQKAELARLLRDAVRARDGETSRPAPVAAPEIDSVAAPLPSTASSSGRLALPSRRRSAEVARIRAALDQKVRESEQLARRMAQPDGLVPGVVALPRKGPRNSLGVSIAEIEAEALVPVGHLALRDAASLPVARPPATEPAAVPVAKPEPAPAPEPAALAPVASTPRVESSSSAAPRATSILPFMPELPR